MKKLYLLLWLLASCNVLLAQWNQNGAGDIYRITGRVNIGTDYFPFSDRLSIEGTSEWLIRLKDKGVGALDWRITSTSDNWWAGGGKFLISQSQTSTDAAFTINRFNNVGIGTVSPNHKLEIADPSGVPTLGLRGAWDSKIIFEAVDASDRFTIWADTDPVTYNDLLRFQAANAANAFTIKGDGNVGIGTINPGSFRLAVEGKIGAREINVTTASWSDYVFEKDYDLRPLAEVEAYINQNKHLPEIPDAKEVETNGVNLGEMNVLLLKKVEELTLYILELKKASDEQAKQIQQLQSKQKSN